MLLITLLLFRFWSVNAAAQDLPEKPFPPRLVNDLAGLLSDNEVIALEEKLVAFNDSTSTQIAIVIVNDLRGYDRADYAHRLYEKWGIGQKGDDNGILILVKTKTSETSRGEVFIATGYGLEGVIPDITCAEIVDYEILPAFRKGDYYTGLDKATAILMSLATGEFPADQYKGPEQNEYRGIGPFFIFLLILLILFIRSKGGSNQRHISRKGLPLWMFLAMMNSGSNRHSGSWGGFSGGSRSGGGSFGGFGGGRSGGGGAGGSW